MFFIGLLCRQLGENKKPRQRLDKEVHSKPVVNQWSPRGYSPLCPTFAVVEKRHDIEMPLKKPRLGFEWQSPTDCTVRGKHTGFFEVVPGMVGRELAISGRVGREKARLVGPGLYTLGKLLQHKHNSYYEHRQQQN